MRIDVPGLPSFISDSVLDLRVPLCGTGRRPCRARPRAHVRANKARSRASRCPYSRARGRRPSPSARGTWPERAGRRAALLGTPKGHMSLRVAAAVHPTPKFRNRTILRGGTSPRHDDARPTLPPRRQTANQGGALTYPAWRASSQTPCLTCACLSVGLHSMGQGGAPAERGRAYMLEQTELDSGRHGAHIAARGGAGHPKVPGGQGLSARGVARPFSSFQPRASRLPAPSP